MLTVVGGTYWEYCEDPSHEELWGSGLRGASLLSNKGFDIEFYSCIAKEDLSTALLTCNTFNLQGTFTDIPETITWEYYHPLSTPHAFPNVFNSPKIILPELNKETVLYYGMIEAEAKVQANYMVYDPQNGVPYLNCDAKANHLAIVLNKKEAIQLSGLSSDTDLSIIGSSLRSQNHAEVVIIKNGSAGGVVICDAGTFSFPIYETVTIWPIGSGDAFSASFCWKWAMEKISPKEAAEQAALLTAYYCESRTYPLPSNLPNYRAIKPKKEQQTIYLAGPFFNMAERWLVTELRHALLSFGNHVFSPMHDVGLIDDVNSEESAKAIASKDIEALESADVILAVASGSDVGTMFEVGFAIARSKRVVILAETFNPNDLTMLMGTNCVITSDFSTAVYKASW